MWAPQWPRGEPAQGETEQEQMPVSPELVAAMKKDRAHTASSLDAIAMDASPFVIRDAPPRPSGMPFLSAWACGSLLHNVCEPRLAQLGILDEHQQLRVSLSMHIDRLEKMPKRVTT